MATFEIGKTYQTRSVCDYDCKISVTVASRTAKFITDIKGKRFGVTVWDGVEQVRPWGRYSMAPIVGADQAIAA